MIEVTLPLPPSTNNLYINLKRGGRAKSGQYKDWLAGAKEACLSAYSAAGWPKYPDKSKMRLTARVGINYRRDVSNTLKPVEDALCAFLPIPDDRYNDQIMAIRDPNCEGFVVCTLSPIESDEDYDQGAESVTKIERPASVLPTPSGPDQKPSITGDD